MKFGIFLILFALKFNSQTLITGQVTDERGLPVSFAKVGFLHKAYGTLCNQYGIYTLNLKYYSPKDSLTFSAIGYEQITLPIDTILKHKNISLKSVPSELEEVIIRAESKKEIILGCNKYSTNNCSGFVKNGSNWKGSEAAIEAKNKKDRRVYISEFSFYIIQNKYSDSLKFRLTFYESNDFNFPKYKSFMSKPVFFKTSCKQGEVIVDLTSYHINVTGNFFISLECLEDELEISKFCYAGSHSTESFAKPGPYEKWKKTRGGGADFKIKAYSVK